MNVSIETQWIEFQILSSAYNGIGTLVDVLCDPSDLIWRKGAQFEAMTGYTAPSSDGLLTEVCLGFPQL